MRHEAWKRATKELWHFFVVVSQVGEAGNPVTDRDGTLQHA